MKYDLIYIDPPWSYKDKTGRDFKHGSEAKYQTMSLEEIKNLPLKEISNKNAVVFMWATVPLMPEAFEVLKAWGFRYKTMLTWRKIMSMGLGYWFRGQTEHLLLGIKGNVKAFRYQKANFYQSKAGRHSEKPDYFRKIVRAAGKKSFGEDIKCLEMFARSNGDRLFDDFEGWEVFGNEVENSVSINNSIPQEAGSTLWENRKQIEE